MYDIVPSQVLEPHVRNLIRFGLLSVIVLAAILLSFKAGHPTVTTLYVAQKNSACIEFGPGTASQPFCTIQEAASVAVAGQTVQVAAGTYPEDVTPAHTGLPGSPITFTAAPGALVTVTGTVADSDGFTIFGKSHITIRDFTISGTAGHGISAILTCSYLRIIGNHITRAGRSTNPSTIRRAINLDVATHSLVQNNVLDRNTSSGVYLAPGSNDNTVDHNIISFNASGYTDPSGKYHRLAPGIDVRGDSNTISHNISHNNDDSGIQLAHGASRNVVANNVSYNNKNYPDTRAGDHGIDVSGAPDNIIVSNTIYDNRTAGINVEGTSTGTRLANNISVNNGLRVSSRTKGDIRVTSTATSGTTIDYDQIYMTYTTGTIITWDSRAFKSLASLHKSYPNVEPHGLQANPDWVNPRSGDFHLMRLSGDRLRQPLRAGPAARRPRRRSPS
jgi:parallel beta-helix repeat protein